jgi:hypothetical protein
MLPVEATRAKQRNHIRFAATIANSPFIVRDELCLLRGRLSWTFVPLLLTFKPQERCQETS